MQAILARSIPYIDADSLASREAQEILFRDEDNFFLYLSNGASPRRSEERIIRVAAREALIWLNEEPEEYGSFWT